MLVCRGEHNELMSKHRRVDRVAASGATLANLLLAGVVLTLIGIWVLQAIRLIGAPIVLSGLLCLVAAARRMRRWTQSSANRAPYGIRGLHVPNPQVS